MAQETDKLGKRFSRGGHSIEVVVEAEAQEKQRKKSRVTLRQPVGNTFTILIVKIKISIMEKLWH